MVSIIEVKTKKQLRCFVDYPNQLYRNVEQFVPATYGDDLEDWDRSKNPAFAYCDARCWLAYRDGEVVGRIGAILSRKANEKWGTNRLRFTQVDFIDDPEVSRALFATVENWAREIGCAAVHGPLGFTDMDREGMLIDGFDRRGCFFTYYNFPYYKEHMAALGYVKDVDWIENLISVPTDERIFQRWEKIANYVLRHHHLHVYEVHNRLGYLPLLKRFFKLVNIAYAPLYGTVELSEEQIRKYSMKFAPLINPKLTCFVMDENNELVAFGVEHRRGAEKEPRPYLPDRLGGVAACVPRERHARPAAHRRAAGSAEKGRERRHHQQGHEGERQNGHQARGDGTHARDERGHPEPVV